MKKLLKNFHYFIQDYWLNTKNPLSWLILEVLVSFGFGVVKINVLITEWSKGFYDPLFSASQASVIYALILVQPQNKTVWYQAKRFFVG